MYSTLVTAMLAAALSISASALGAQDSGGPPDLTSKGTRDDSHDWNLGPTGARGWIWASKLETTAARQILITQVAKGSPASGVLEVDDVILGVGNKAFASDARRAFGEAIGEAERAENKGALNVLRWRKGKTESVSIPLQSMGTYGAKAPYDCEKSKRIFEQGCKAIAAKMKTATEKERGHPIVRALNALALLASGKPEYQALIREEARWAAAYSMTEQGYPSWSYGYVNLFLAEYVLATQDAEAVPGLTRLTLAIAHGQSKVGSWGHRFAYPNGSLEGYGAMHQPGLPLTMSLVLARQAGVKDAALDLAIERSDRFIGFYIGKGCIPYGDHHPWMQTHDDNGKCAAGAVLFDLLGNRQGAEFFSRMTTASYGGERDTGHTGNFFNIFWALPGISRSGPEATGAWMREFAWSLDLARRWDGTYGYQGEPGIPASSSDHQYRDWDCTGAYVLGYALPLKSLYITGKKASVAPQLSAAEARGVIEDGRGWSPQAKAYGYETRTVEQLITGLSNWSPVVRERSGQELAKRDGDSVPRLLKLLESTDSASRLGAAQALAALGKRATAAVPALRHVLWDDDLWLRIKAAEALADIGDAAKSAVPDLLKMLTTSNANDPRGMVQRYVAFCLFYPGNVLSVHGMVARSLEGVDRRMLYPAIEAALGNEDGRAREAVSSTYGNLSFEEIRPVLPAVVRAIVNPAPSGEMFADGIRVRGVELLAKNHIADGIPLCVALCEPARWGSAKRIGPCMKALESYGAAAKSQLPELHKLEAVLSMPKANALAQVKIVQHAIASIEAATETPALQTMTTLSLKAK